MNKKVFWLSLIAVAASFVGGFLLANALNRREMDNLRAETARAKNSMREAEKNSSDQTLTEEEIRRKIAEADKNPENIEFQRGLATALYRYASMKRESRWLSDVARLLQRAHENNPKDYDTIISLGNIHFDIAENNANSAGETKNDVNGEMEKSRTFFHKALDIKPNETNARTSLGMTYLFENPPQNERATAEFQKSLKSNPADEKALENITRAFINSGKTKEAEESLDKLKQSNPNNEVLNDLNSLLGQAKQNK